MGSENLYDILADGPSPTVIIISVLTAAGLGGAIWHLRSSGGKHRGKREKKRGHWGWIPWNA